MAAFLRLPRSRLAAFPWHPPPLRCPGCSQRGLTTGRRPPSRSRNPLSSSAARQQPEAAPEMAPSKAEQRAQKEQLEQELKRQMKQRERLQQRQPKARLSLYEFDDVEGDVDPMEAQSIASRLGEDQLPHLSLDAAERAATFVQRLESWWFRGWQPGQAPSKRHLDLWFYRTMTNSVRLKALEFQDDFTNLMAEKYRRIAGPYSQLEQTVEGNRASIILLKQVTRYLCPENPDALVDFNHLASLLTTQALALQPLNTAETDFVQASFLIMPWIHSESLQESHMAFHWIRSTAVPPAYEEFKLVLEEDAARHLYELDRFGRYPGRNSILGRESTEEELEWLEEHGGDEEHLVGKR